MITIIINCHQRCVPDFTFIITPEMFSSESSKTLVLFQPYLLNSALNPGISHAEGSLSTLSALIPNANDVIESISVNGPSATIKSHHNVGGLPDYMKLQIVEPLNTLFKDEVRRIGKSIGIDADILGRHPFPGPGLGIRI